MIGPAHRRFARWTTVAVALFSLAGIARAQNVDDAIRAFQSSNITQSAESVAVRQTQGRPSLAGPIDAAHYVLGPGDVLSLEYGGRAFDTKVFTVDSEGRVRVPNLGLVMVGGKTLAQTREEIVRRLKPFVPGATLDLRLLQARTFKVFVMGEVRHPGTQEVTGSARASEAIEGAGGVNPGGSRRSIQVVRRNGDTVVADLDRFEKTGDWDANPYLEDGDRLMAPSLLEHMGVFGAVARPNFYEFRPGDSLSTAIRLAGGLRPEARADSVFIVRFRGAQQLDTLYTSLEGSSRSGVMLQADDRVFVRSQPQWRPTRQVNISGEVRYPGTYAIQEGQSRVSDLIRWAGGFTPGAAQRNVRLGRNLAPGTDDVEFDRLSRLSRAEMTNTEYQTFRGKLALRQSVYLIDFTAGAPRPAEADVMLRDGDRIDVPRLELAVRVDGSVKNPGLVTFEEGKSTSDYIHLAGGSTTHADVSGARITRAGSTTTLLARDVRRIEPGDFIWVPERKETNFWLVARDLVIVAGQVATIVLVIDQLNRP